MPRIIADDLGLYPSVNDGIIFLLKESKIDGASLMANGEAFEDAVSKIKGLEFQFQIGIHPHTQPAIASSAVADIRRLSVGVHFVLVDEKSLSGIKFPKNHRTFFIKYVLGLIKLSDIEKELSTQLDRCLQVGIKPAFINSHQHLHLLPGIMNLVIKIAKENDIKYIRLVNEPIHGRAKLFRKVQLKFLTLLSKMAKKKLNKAGISYNNVFVGFINAGNLTQDDVELARQIDSITELGCHPGYETSELREKYKHWGNYNWQKELEILSRQS